MKTQVLPRTKKANTVPPGETLINALREMNSVPAGVFFEMEKSDCMALVEYIDRLTSKRLTWHATTTLPDDNTTVAIALVAGDVSTGYHEDNKWYLEAGTLVTTVYAWAHLPAAPLTDELR